MLHVTPPFSFRWARVEQQRNIYDFSSYDTLLATMEQHGVRPYWILDYGNALYPSAPGTPSQSCDTQACIDAYGRFAAAAAAHFSGHHIIWET